ncbi:MAG: LptF/LptG family permease [Devosia sp.]
MSRIDYLLLKRLSSRIGLVLAVLLGLFALAQSLDARHISDLMEAGGPLLVISGIAAVAARIIVGTLPVPVVIGTIIAVLDLQSRRELTVIKATGLSIWRVLRMPLLLAVVTGLLVSLLIEPVIVKYTHSLPLPTTPAGSGGVLWLEQQGPEGTYLLTAERARQKGRLLETVSVFLTEAKSRDRIEASSAELSPGMWVLSDAVRYRPNQPTEILGRYELGTTTSAGDMQVRFTLPRDLNLIELWSAWSARIADPTTRAAVLTSMIRQLVLPALLAGAVLIGFAFTSGYRRTNKYGVAVLYGVVLGFVVYVVTELASQAGLAGVLDPTIAAAGPAFVAIVIGLTVLLFREDGRT